MNKLIRKMLEEVSERMEEADKQSVGLSDCHEFPAYVCPTAPGVRTRYYVCAWCGKACDLSKKKQGD